MKKISVVIPMYNSFHMMERNLKVLSKQEGAEIEIIIVDDCSTDDSYVKAKKYADNHSNIVVLKNEKNSGPGSSRNAGLLYVTGDYITFADADDYFSDDFTEIITPLLDQNIECIIFDYIKVNEFGNILSVGYSVGGNVRRDTFIDPRDAFVYVHGSPWGKIYRTDIIRNNDINFANLYRNEDMPFTKCAVAMSDRVYYSSAQLYRYTQISTSLMHTEYLTDERNAMVAFDIVYKKMAHFNLEEELFAIELREVLNNTVLIRLRKKEKRVEIASFIKNRYKKNHIHNRYFSRYSLPTKVITYCAYYRMFGLLSLLLILKKTFRR